MFLALSFRRVFCMGRLGPLKTTDLLMLGCGSVGKRGIGGVKWLEQERSAKSEMERGRDVIASSWLVGLAHSSSAAFPDGRAPTSQGAFFASGRT
jgi:hypothetical protein